MSASNLLTDWDNLLNNKISPKDFTNTYWERFIPVYVTVYRKCDEADLWIKLLNLVTRAYNRDITPLFEHENQLFTYIKKSFLNNKIQEYNKLRTDTQTQALSLDETILPISMNNSKLVVNSESDVLEKIFLENIFNELVKMLTNNQKEVLVLYMNGYTPKETSRLLGISLLSFWNRINQICIKVKNNFPTYLYKCN